MINKIYDALDTLRQNSHLFANGIFKLIFVNENCCILIQILLKYVPKVAGENKPSFVQIMAWHGTDDKPLSETVMA